MGEDAYKDFWESYGDTSAFVEVIDEGEGSLATRVLEDYQINYQGNEGGELSGLDILRMDAMTVIRLSLLEHSANHGGFWEPIVNEDGYVEFKSIGSYGSEIEGHIYYELQTMDYVEQCAGVMITGRKPLPERLPIEWKPIWGTDPDNVEIYSLNLMKSNCLLHDYTQYASIVFKDPQFATSYEDGIDNIYEIDMDNPWDTVVGYVYFKNAKNVDGTDLGSETQIEYTQTSTIPIKIGDDPTVPFGPKVGTLVNHPTFHKEDEDECWADMGLEGIVENGIPIPIPDKFRYTSVRGTKVDTFVRVSSIVFVGTLLSAVAGRPKIAADAVKTDPTSDNTDVWVSINTSKTSTFRLDAGTHYVIAYKDEDEFKTPYVAFANNARRYDPALFGSNIRFKIDPMCEYSIQKGGVTEGAGTIVPVADTKGVWVKEIWAMVELATPSIQIYDPRGQEGAALAIAKNLEYWTGPIVMRDPPAPIAFNGTLIDQAVGIQDHDPTTAQDLTNTPMEEALDEMSRGSGLSLSLSFLDEQQTIKLSEELYDYMNSGDGIMTNYVCGPECSPKLGGIGPAGGVINEISYSYNDSGSYTISVNEGPRLVGGLSSISGGPVFKQAEEVSARGTIIQDMGNHIYYKVRIDGFGDRIAINYCHNILRVGDKVQCSIHNNPVES